MSRITNNNEHGNEPQKVRIKRIQIKIQQRDNID